MASKHPITFRVSNIPQDASLQNLKDALSGAMLPDEKSISIEATIVPSTGDDSTNTALVAFVPRTPKYVEPLLGDAGNTLIDTPLGDLSFDTTFYGLTQLYATAPGERIVADIIAVTGLDGHAYGSWRSKGSLPRMWLRDFFSKDLQSCRTMVYGYDTKLRHHNIHTLYDYKIDLLEQIKKARKTNEQKRRPLIFIAHSFGGIVTVHALVKAEEALEWDDDPETHTIYKATKALMFFGTPHRGLQTEDILSMIDTKSHAERAELVRSIGQNSAGLAAELQKFSYFADRFKIYSFYERQKTRSIVITDGIPARTGNHIVPVDIDSALLSLPGVNESPIPVDGDHSTMVKFNSQTDRTYKTVLSYIRQTLESLDLQGVADPHNIIPTKLVGPESTKALIEAIQRCDVESVRLLLATGVSADGRDLEGVTALHHAARTGDEEILRMLITNGAHIQARDLKGKSPVDYARSCGRIVLAIKLQTGRL
ncbi:hypothetical protein FN846DRAFT_959301 [Sphaerosporella brunnea]|uniref:Uncharacterized protein n=1 Tax=Sphaerosporella brunnea TaxID=1250544 RepID=A0A5J5ERF7_9PEZI|nr:hypothetical protein FN846DRAFT_959301 [Sphaerosporella brunnea]